MSAWCFVRGRLLWSVRLLVDFSWLWLLLFIFHYSLAVCAVWVLVTILLFSGVPE